MEDKIITIRRFNNPIEANIVKGLLEANGIECFISDEAFVGMNPIYDAISGGIRLQILEKDKEIAVQILDNIQELEENDGIDQ